MLEDEKVGTIHTKRQRLKIEGTEPPPQYVVKTKGYQETYGNLEDAKRQYDVLKKRSVKSQESIKLELSEVDSKGNKKILENVSIGEEFFK